jgi:glycosyltransferase involved in cell wall biosynthesis
MKKTKPCIGIDASRAISKVPTGTEAYSYHLIRALLPELSEHYQTKLYLREALQKDTFPNAEHRIIPFPRLWTHIRLSWEMWQQPPDLLFVPAHVLPLVRPQRTLVTIHDLGFQLFPEAHPPQQRRYLEWSTRWNARVATHIIADSKATRDAIICAYQVPKAKITVVYPGYDSTLAPVTNKQTLERVRIRYSIPGDYILAIGRIQPRKNLARLIRAFGNILSYHPHLTLVLAGPVGWLADPIIQHVHNLGLERRVLFPGYITAQDKAALISGAKIFAYPSLYEGFGFPALEAQACGVPLLASNTSSLPEVVGDGGLLIDPLDENAITQGLKLLLENNDRQQHLITHGKENLKRFSWDITANLVTEIIHQLTAH